jgi:anaerobic C4-dicarboxylate transporter
MRCQFQGENLDLYSTVMSNIFFFFDFTMLMLQKENEQPMLIIIISVIRIVQLIISINYHSTFYSPKFLSNFHICIYIFLLFFSLSSTTLFACKDDEKEQKGMERSGEG